MARPFLSVDKWILGVGRRYQKGCIIMISTNYYEGEEESCSSAAHFDQSSSKECLMGEGRLNFRLATINTIIITTHCTIDS